MNNTKKYHISNLHPEIFSAGGPSSDDLEKWFMDLSIPTADDMFRALNVSTGLVSRHFGALDKPYRAIYRELFTTEFDVPYALCEHVCNVMLARIESGLESAVSLDEGFWKSIVMKIESGGICDNVCENYGRFWRKPIKSCDDAIDGMIEKFIDGVCVRLSDAYGPMERVASRLYLQSDFNYDVAGTIAEMFVNTLYACVRVRIGHYITDPKTKEIFPVSMLLFSPTPIHILRQHAGYREFYDTSLIGTEGDVENMIDAVIYVNSCMRWAVNGRMLINAVGIGSGIARKSNGPEQEF